MRRVCILLGDQGTGKSVLANFIGQSPDVNIIDDFDPNKDELPARFYSKASKAFRWVIVSQTPLAMWPTHLYDIFQGSFVELRGIS